MIKVLRVQTPLLNAGVDYILSDWCTRLQRGSRPRIVYTIYLPWLVALGLKRQKLWPKVKVLTNILFEKKAVWLAFYNELLWYLSLSPCLNPSIRLVSSWNFKKFSDHRDRLISGASDDFPIKKTASTFFESNQNSELKVVLIWRLYANVKIRPTAMRSNLSPTYIVGTYLNTCPYTYSNALTNGKCLEKRSDYKLPP